MNDAYVVISIFCIILFLTGIVLLQIFFSKRENKWLGLIFPAVSLMFSIIFYLNMAVLSNQSTMQVILQAIMVLLLLNIPTAILIAIYFACRERFKKHKEIDKMNIQDL